MPIKNFKQCSISIIILLLGFAVVFSIGCKKINCEAFDYSHPIMEWFLFPDRAESYTYFSEDTSALKLNQKAYTYSEAKEESCNQCACFIELYTEYNIDETDVIFRCRATYETYYGDNPGQVYYGNDSVGTVFHPVGEELQQSFQQEYNFSKKDTAFILGKKYFDVYEFESIDKRKTRIAKFWTKKDVGMIGFRYQSKEWLREDL